MITFDDLCMKWKVTPKERKELVFFLAALRYKNTIEKLLKGGINANL